MYHDFCISLDTPRSITMREIWCTVHRMKGLCFKYMYMYVAFMFIPNADLLEDMVYAQGCMVDRMKGLCFKYMYVAFCFCLMLIPLIYIFPP